MVCSQPWPRPWPGNHLTGFHTPMQILPTPGCALSCQPASQPALQSCLLNSLHVPTCWPHPVAFFSAGLLLSTLPPGVDLCGGGTVSSGVRLLQSALSLPFGCGSPGLLQSLLLQLPFQQGSATSSLLWHPRGQICSRSGSDFPSSQ